MGNDGRDHGKSTSPTSPLKQGPLNDITQNCVQTAFKYLQGDKV